MTTLEPRTNLRPTRALPGAAFQNFITPTPRTLEQVVQATVCALADCSLKPLTPGDAGPFAQTRAVLALVIHCYARQIYGSADVAVIARHDLDYSRLGGEGFPDAQTVRRFRSENREVIHRGLMVALHFLVEQKISLGALTKVSDTQLAEEASRRIIMATFIDSLEPEAARVTDPPAEISYLFANDQARVH